jgi:lipopolysaccharide/colanic/teichoic acid biosynthesis glycosyltransferase
MEHRKIEYQIKRLFDICFASLFLFASSPFIILSMVVIKIHSKNDPVVFRQIRIGYNEKPFTIYKLRTMTNETNTNGIMLSDEQRTKRWGKVIRSINIDEIPQMINILRGEMSLIGPRPILPDQMKVMTKDEQRRRQSVKPGITGWEAVNEAKAPTREDKVIFDLFYVDNWSLKLDCRIFFRTLVVILFGLRPEDSIRAPEMKPEQIKKIDT